MKTRIVLSLVLLFVLALPACFSADDAPAADDVANGIGTSPSADDSSDGIGTSPSSGDEDAGVDAGTTL